MSVPQRFGILRLIGTLLKVLAWLALILSILLALGLGLAGPLARQFVGDVGDSRNCWHWAQQGG